MSKLRIMVVDDEPNVREVAEMILELGGFDVVASAGDGDEAIALVSESPPEAILMDLRMARVGGIEATRVICHTRPDIRVVIFSAYDDPAIKREAFAAGASGFLVKGCGAAEILDAFAA
jgi:DNA-binding NarL/FixJ family response regulator